MNLCVERIQRMCFICKKINTYDSIWCRKCKTNTNIPIGYYSTKFKKCMVCNRINLPEKVICDCCGSYPLYEKTYSEPSKLERIFREGIKAFSSSDYDMAYKAFYISGMDYGFEWGLLALAECYRHGYGVEKNTEEEIRCLMKCYSKDAQYKLKCVMFENELKKDVKYLVPSSYRTLFLTPSKVMCSQILDNHPVISENCLIQQAYIYNLENIIEKIGLKIGARSEYYNSILNYYKTKFNIITKNCTGYKNAKRLPERVKKVMLLDLFSILGYNGESIKNCRKKIESVVPLGVKAKKMMDILCSGLSFKEECWGYISADCSLRKNPEWLELIKNNADFINREPYKILVTATMSSGKSTFINALVGKNINMMRNTACTSKIHQIISKPFEDGLVSKLDYNFILDAKKDDLHINNDRNKSDKIYIGSYFNGALQGLRFIINDSPGVNSSENEEHKIVATEMIKQQDYDLVIYVLNATQLGTNDDEEHLQFVKNNIGDKNIVFIINKVDEFRNEDDNAIQIINKHKKYLEKIGFKNPMICPVSARAAYLARKSTTEELSRIEKRELFNYMDKFEINSLDEYYPKNGIVLDAIEESDDVQKLLKNCGFLYFEQVIINHYLGGKNYDASLRKI